MIEFDIFDPNLWENPAHEFRIYGDDNATTWAVVDEIDYHWAIQWKWSFNKPHPTRNGKKLYLRRSQANSRRYLPPLYLHVEILKRTGVLPESELHDIADHFDGDEFNCRRKNLRWATQLTNNRNRFGLHARQTETACLI